VLGRCLRSVVLVDAGRPRNRFACAVHAFPTREGVTPAALARLLRRDVARYGSVERADDVVRSIRRAGRGGFDVETVGGRRLFARTVLLATGVVDRVPAFPGAAEAYGTSVHHCPICDGFEVRGRRLAAFGPGSHGVASALAITRWSDDVVLFTHGERVATPTARRLARAGVRVESRRIARLDVRRGRLRAVVLERGVRVPRDALFFATGQRKRDALASSLGCGFGRRGVVRVDREQETTVPRVYAAGDLTAGSQMVVVASAEGTAAALAIHERLLREELRAPARRRGRPRRSRERGAAAGR
jgi:thioredoxin reductase